MFKSKQKSWIFKNPLGFALIIIFISILSGGITAVIVVANFSSLINLSDRYLPITLSDSQRSKLGNSNQRSLTEKSTTQVVEEVIPSVVSIVVTKELKNYRSTYSPEDFFGFDLPFNFIFPRAPYQNEPKTEKRQIGGGTGFIIADDGLIVTNKHVVSDESAEYSVTLYDGSIYQAEVLARDTFNDLAVLKIKAENLQPVVLGDSDQLKVGQTVIAIGYSLGEYSNSVTRGIISGMGRDIVASSGAGRSEALEDVIQTDAAINPGNSGGPLLNLIGEVIGINTAVSRQGQLVGFAIPINSAKTVIQSVREHGKIIRPFLGVRYILLNEAIAKRNGLKVNYGALILRGETMEDLAIIPGSPADKAGLAENDIILEVNGKKIEVNNSLAKEITKYRPGDTIDLKVWHKGEEKLISVVLTELE